MMKSKLRKIVVVSGSGAIGGAFTKLLSETCPDAEIMVFSRGNVKVAWPDVTYLKMDYNNEASIEEAARLAAESSPIDLVIIATGILHGESLMPEKSLRDLSADKFRQVFEANTIFPALLMKHFLPKLNREDRSVLAVLSARVGSVSDNRLGGWYAYRASKAALNMIVKNAAIETSRRNGHAVIVGLHPGTVDSELSKPFQRSVPENKLFTPEFSAGKMLEVLDSLSPDQSGKCFAWDGQEVFP